MKQAVLRQTRTIAVTSGKGGVGKTSIAINTAIALARLGKKVCVFDADTSLANVNIMLGLYPEYTMEHVYAGEKTFSEIVSKGPHGVDIIPGASGFTDTLSLDEYEQARFLDGLSQLEKSYDYFIVDTAAGIANDVLHYIGATQIALLVITPEPTSLTDAFSLLKVLKKRGYKRKVQVVVNMASGVREAKRVFSRFEMAVSKYLGMDCQYLASIWSDESVRAAVALQRPVASLPRSDVSTQSFFRLAEGLDKLFASKKKAGSPFSLYWKRVLERRTDKQRLSGDKVITKHGNQASISKDNSANENNATPSWHKLQQDLSFLLANTTNDSDSMLAFLKVCFSSIPDQKSAVLTRLVEGVSENIEFPLLSSEQLEAFGEVLDNLSEAMLQELSSERRIHSKQVALQEGSVQPLEVEAVKAATPVISGNDHIASMLDSIKYASQVNPE